MRRLAIGGVAAIGLAFLASVALVERWTRVEVEGERRPGARAVETPPSQAPPNAAVRPPAFVDEPRAASPSRPEPPPASVAPKPGPNREVPRAPASGEARLQFAFRLDPRLTRSLHMGDRWVSPPAYSRTGDPSGLTIRARARVVGDDGPPRAPSDARWTASEPDMIAFSPDQGDEVELVVLRAGESWIAVDAGEARGSLQVKAVPVGGRLRVDVAQ